MVMLFRKSIERFKSQPPVSATKIVMLRTVTIMILLLTTLLMTMAVMLRPWKTENVEGRTNTLEIGIFHVCRATKKGIKCYPGEHEIESAAWFMTFRWFLLISTFFGYMAVFYSVIQLIRTPKEIIHVFVVPAGLSLAAGCLSITALLMLLGYWDFEHLDDTRLYKMGWKEDRETEEFVNWPNNMAWGACVLFFFDFLLCIYAHIKDVAFMRSFKMNALKIEAEKRFNKL